MTVWVTEDQEFLVRWYECLRKQQFETFAAAEERALTIMREHPVRNNGQATNLSAYQCEHCQRFHYGKRRVGMAGKSPSRVMKEAKKLWKHYEDRGYQPPYTDFNRQTVKRAM